MNFNKLSIFFSKQKRKNNGAIAFTTIILSGLIISVGIGMVAILAREIQFTTDLVISEKSYFAAESGVEIALAELKINPVENVVDHEIDLGNSYTYLNIENLVDDFELELDPLEARKFRLKIDQDETLEDDFGYVDNFSIKRNPNVPFWWKVLCKKQVFNSKNQSEEGKTISLQGFLEADKNLNTGLLGTFDDENGDIKKSYTMTDFFSSLDEEEKQSCFLSITNLDDTNVSVFTIGGNSQIAPYQAIIKSVGKVSVDAGNKYQKTIEFSTEQEGLSSFFDFGLYQK